MRAVRIFAICFLALSFACPLRAAAPRSWTLRLLPTAGSVEYHLATTDTVSVEAGGRVTTHTTPLHRIVTRRITPVPGAPPPGLYEVEQSDRELAVKVGRGTLSLGGGKAAKFRVHPDGSGDGAPELDLVLPAQPVALGARWESTAPGTLRQPLPLRTTYRLEREETIAGHRCLLIAAEVSGEADGPKGSHLTHRAKARLAFDPRAGLLVRAISDARTMVTQPRDAKGPRRRETHIRSRLELAP